MIRPSSLLSLAALACIVSYAQAMDCNMLGISISCPTRLDDSSKAFCCVSSISDSIPYCCDIEDYIKQNTGILAGILVGAIILLIICTLCCCCFCSCCLLAKRRTHRGRVLYDPVRVANDQPSNVTSMSYVHPPPPNQVHSPPPSYYSPTNSQPPLNPNYKY